MVLVLLLQNIAHAFQPAVSSDCSKNFWVGDSYCVGVSNKPCTHTTTTTHPMTRLTKPDKPTQTDIINTCNAWYDVVKGDSCSVVEAAFKISHAQFLAWNVGFPSACGIRLLTEPASGIVRLHQELCFWRKLLRRRRTFKTHHYYYHHHQKKHSILYST